MGSNIIYINVTPDEIIKTIYDSTWRNVISTFLDYFNLNKIKYKVTSNYSIHVNIKGKLSINLNTRELVIQIRIRNPITFNNLDLYSENIRNQILNAYPCQRCTPNGGQFMGHNEIIFTYQGVEYCKCNSWCANFRFINLSDTDISSLIGIVDNEFLLNKQKRIV